MQRSISNYYMTTTPVDSVPVQGTQLSLCRVEQMLPLLRLPHHTTDRDLPEILVHTAVRPLHAITPQTRLSLLLPIYLKTAP